MSYKFQLPPGKTEQEVLDAIEKAVRLLAPSFVFGYYSIEDIQQEARVEGLLSLKKYDPSRPLENFVYVHIHNRLCNLKRDKYRRNDAPCAACASGQPCNDGSFCKKYDAWLKRNHTKANLMQPLDLGAQVGGDAWQSFEPSAEEEAIQREMLTLIDAKLPTEMRAIYLQLRSGVKVPKSKREAVVRAVKEILRCSDEED